MDRSVFHGSRLIGSAIGGFCVSLLGAASAFFLNAFSFLALIASLISIPRRPAGSAEEEEQRRSGIMDGVRYVRSNRIILSMIMLIMLNTIFIFPAISPVMLPLYVRNILKLGPGELGWLMAVSGTGAFLGSLGLLSIAREKRLKFMSGNVLAVASGGVFFMSRSAYFSPQTRVFDGSPRHRAFHEFWSGEHKIVQEHAPMHLRGRVSAVFGLSFFGLMPIAGIFVPGISDLIGMRTALLVSAICFGAGSIFVLTMCGHSVCESPVKTPAEPEPEIASAL